MSACSVLAYTRATCRGGASDTVRGVPGSGAMISVPVAAMPERATVKPASTVSNKSCFHASSGCANARVAMSSGSACAKTWASARAGSISRRLTPCPASLAASCAGHAWAVAHHTSARTADMALTIAATFPAWSGAGLL